MNRFFNHPTPQRVPVRSRSRYPQYERRDGGSFIAWLLGTVALAAAMMIEFPWG